MKYLFVFLIAILPAAAFAQSPGPAADQNDPAAKKLLDKVRKKYEGYKTLEAAFSLTIEVPTQPREVQKGTVGQSGNKFRLDMDQQTIISDGVTTWVYLKKNNEVQINNANANTSEEGFLTPSQLLNRYQKGDYLYTITDKVTENGKLLTQIEFKPKNRNSEYSKLRVSIDEKTSTIDNIRAFAKDGSRYIFRITRLTPNKTFSGAYFTFDTKQYPGVHVEDLRM